MRKRLFCAAFGLFAGFCQGQKSYGVTQDCYLYRNGVSRLVPAVYGRTNKGWYGQLRYNYEEAQTLSLLAGRTFAKKGLVDCSITPQGGLLLGKFSGAGAGFQAEVRTGFFSFFVEPQYCASFSEMPPFFYNWSELTVQPVHFFYAGFALQQTATHKERFVTEPGFVVGLNAGKLELPIYYFRQKNSDGYLVLGLHWKLER